MSKGTKKSYYMKKLSVRKWEGCLNNRNINASINILDKGMKLYLEGLNKELNLIENYLCSL